MERVILLVDSDVNFRRALGIALRLEGLAVDEAGSLHEAWRKLAARSFDHVLVDLLLPGGDGLELVESILQRHPSVRVLVCSAHPESFGAARVRVPAAIQLEKPFTVERLLGVLRTTDARAPRARGG